MKIDWKKKLTSRKFWVSIAGFVSMLIVACGVAEEVATQVSAIIMAGASVIGYAIGEGLADSKSEYTINESIEFEDEDKWWIGAILYVQ